MKVISEKHAYEELANAIVLQAVEDYRTALMAGEENKAKACENFFRSEYYMILTNVNGENLIKQIRKEVEETKKKLEGGC